MSAPKSQRYVAPMLRVLRVLHVFLFVWALLPFGARAQPLPWLPSVCLPCEDCERIKTALSTTTVDLRSLEVRTQRALEWQRWRRLEAEAATTQLAGELALTQAQLEAERADGFPWLPVVLIGVAVFASGVAAGVWIDRRL
ncbi:MAG: hypothetical protein E6Q97_00345 [Desulfurellales bacterium]|nr:MAG: hypothetical protein E6Q97_00345 [Desulfurellales bacterium]